VRTAAQASWTRSSAACGSCARPAMRTVQPTCYQPGQAAQVDWAGDGELATDPRPPAAHLSAHGQSSLLRRPDGALSGDMSVESFLEGYSAWPHLGGGLSGPEIAQGLD